MIKITIGENQGNQRLDRFLKKYFPEASLSHIYRLIRKDVKINGKRKRPETLIETGDQLILYMAEEEASLLRGGSRRTEKKSSAKKQFSVVYEDSQILIADKPLGLLTHGDYREKKNHLANQVVSYLIEKGDYDPRTEKTFVPSPANRLDRNTTGLVLFGKTLASLQELNRMLRERDGIEKLYMTIATGKIDHPLKLKDTMTKDVSRNLVSAGDDTGKIMETDIVPIEVSEGRYSYTLSAANIHTGRTHQIRIQLARAGFPIIGDSKYGNDAVNRYVKEKYGLTTQLLHAYKLRFGLCREDGPLSYLSGREFECSLPERFQRIKKDIFG